MGKPVLQEFLCCVSLQTGSKIVIFLTTLLSGIASFLYPIAEEYNRQQIYASKEVKLFHENSTVFLLHNDHVYHLSEVGVTFNGHERVIPNANVFILHFFGWWNMFIGCAYIVVGVMAFSGVFQEKRVLLLPYCIMHAIMSALYLSLTLHYTFYEIESPLQRKMTFIAAFAASAVWLYILLVVYSLYQMLGKSIMQLKEMRLYI